MDRTNPREDRKITREIEGGEENYGQQVDIENGRT